jgi:co-chaperonin GroES (HSP10)
MAQLHPTFTNVLVILDRKEERTASGIVLPEVCRSQKANEAVTGEVCGVGPDVPAPIRLGVAVVVPAHKGTEYHAAGRQYVVLKAKEVLAVVEP